jgi:hypothetical protein
MRLEGFANNRVSSLATDFFFGVTRVSDEEDMVLSPLAERGDDGGNEASWPPLLLLIDELDCLVMVNEWNGMLKENA